MIRHLARGFARSARALVGGALLLAAVPASALPIYVINAGVSGHSMVISAISNLVALGHTVTTGGTLASYAGFAQVWDLRYDGTLGAADITAMGAYLASGGRMYMTGEHAGFDALRNTSLVSWVSGVGGGAMTLSGGFFAGPQVFTAAGSAAGLDSTPNAFASISYAAAQEVTAASVSQGFLATETSAGSGSGSLVGWDFGDITGAAGARMLLGFDIEIFSNGIAWTENMAVYLASPAVAEPATVGLLGMALAGLGLARRRRTA